MKNWTLKAQVLIFAAVIFSSVMTASAQTTVFTYQGRLNDATLPQPTNGSYEMQYKLFDSATVGTGQQLGTTQTVPNVSVVNGIFYCPNSILAEHFFAERMFILKSVCVRRAARRR